MRKCYRNNAIQSRGISLILITTRTPLNRQSVRNRKPKTPYLLVYFMTHREWKRTAKSLKHTQRPNHACVSILFFDADLTRCQTTESVENVHGTRNRSVHAIVNMLILQRAFYMSCPGQYSSLHDDSRGAFLYSMSCPGQMTPGCLQSEAPRLGGAV